MASGDASQTELASLPSWRLRCLRFAWEGWGSLASVASFGAAPKLGRLGELVGVLHLVKPASRQTRVPSEDQECHPFASAQHGN